MSHPQPSERDDSLAEWSAQIDFLRKGSESVDFAKIPLNPSRLLELACRDLLKGWRDGTPRHVEDYLSDANGLCGRDAILELIDAELLACSMSGRMITELNLEERFAEFQKEISIMIELLEMESKVSEPSRRPLDEPVRLPDGFKPLRDVHGLGVGRQILAQSLRTGKKVWVEFFLLEPTSEVPAAQARINQLLALDHPRLWPVLSSEWATDQGFAVVSKWYFGALLDQRLLHENSFPRIWNWVRQLAAMLAFAEYNQLSPCAMSVERILVDLDGNLLVPLWNFHEHVGAMETWSNQFDRVLRQVLDFLRERSDLVDSQSFQKKLTSLFPIQPDRSSMDQILARINHFSN